MKIAIGFLVVMAIINAAVTVWIYSVDGLTTKQKVAQVCVIWLLPVVGALCIAIYLFSIRDTGNLRSISHHIPLESDYPAINFDSSHESFGSHSD